MKRAVTWIGIWALLGLAGMPLSALGSDWVIPTFKEVKADYVPSEAWLLDRNGEVLTEKRIDPKVRRLEWVSVSDLSPAIKQTLVLTEDKNFYKHAGVDWEALFGSAWLYLWHMGDGKHPRGASTLTMQLAGFLDPHLHPKGSSRTLSQKWNQILIARELEKKWTKQEILEAYFNLAPFRGEIVGIHAISLALFGKEPSSLNRPESMLLVALLRGTTAKPQVVAKRACSILPLMKKGHNPTCGQLNELAISTLSQSKYDIPENNIAPHLAQKLLSKPGSKVSTTLEVNLQRFATQSIQEHLSALQDQDVKDGAVIVLDNASGDILAYVGSNAATSDSPDVDGVQALRQPGSTLKPFLYGMAIEQKLLTAASVLDDSPIQLVTPSGLYIPQNYDRDFKGPVTVRTALASSLNVPAVRTLSIVGEDRFVQELRDFGLDSVNQDGDFYGFGLALGGTDVRLAQLTNAYRALANGGLWSQIGFTASDHAGITRRVLSPQAAFIIADILSDSDARSTTFGFDNPLATRAWSAVKTGTSKDMRDNWCIGFSDRYTVGVWVGNFSGEPMRDVSGISGAAPVWRDVIEYLSNNRKSVQRKIPENLVAEQVHFVPAVEPPRKEWFIKGTEESEVRLAAYDGNEKELIPRIMYPKEGTIIAIDPDIPMSHQRIQFIARSTDDTTWYIDGSQAGNGSEIWWNPAPGHHKLLLTDSTGNEIDKVSFEVRGDLVK